ncbi:TPA: hypothetical protein ACSP3W_004073 [Aeromonas veronii]
MTENQILEYSATVENWIPMQALARELEHWDYKKLCNVTSARHKNGLARACRRDGKRLLINKPLFGLWLAGKLQDAE